METCILYLFVECCRCFAWKSCFLSWAGNQRFAWNDRRPASVAACFTLLQEVPGRFDVKVPRYDQIVVRFPNLACPMVVQMRQHGPQGEGLWIELDRVWGAGRALGTLQEPRPAPMLPLPSRQVVEPAPRRRWRCCTLAASATQHMQFVAAIRNKS